MDEERPTRGFLTTVLRCYCPRCREGKLFRNKVSIRMKRNMEMNEFCPECGQVTDLEIGFYYGTGYVSYLVSFAISIFSFLFWMLTIGFSLSDDRFMYWVIFNSLLLIFMQPYLMRLARSIWISCFIKYDPNWENTRPEDPERVNRSQMNNW